MGGTTEKLANPQSGSRSESSTGKPKKHSHIQSHKCGKVGHIACDCKSKSVKGAEASGSSRTGILTTESSLDEFTD